MTRNTGSQVIAQMLDAYGVTHLYFVPTILNATLVELESTTSISRVVTHSEIAAAYMADGYARASGRPGVCMAQTVGAANLAAGLRDARLTASPILAFTGGPMRNSRDRHQYQEIEDRPMFHPVTKTSLKVDHVDRLPAVLRQAFRVATSGKPGPVHIEFVGHHGDVLEKESTDETPSIEDRHRQLPPYRPAGDEADIEAAVAVLAGAARPLLVVGGGIRQSDAAAELVSFAESFSIPVVTSLTGKDVLPGQHPLNAGVVGQYSRKTANKVTSEADVLIFIGTRAGSQSTFQWRVPSPAQTVIHIDIDPEVTGLNYLNAVSVIGDARTILNQLKGAMPAVDAAGRSEWLDRVSDIVAGWYADTTELRKSDAVPIRPERLCADLSDVLPFNAMVVADTGHAGAWTAGWLDLNSGEQRLIRSAGTLGWAFPAGIGAQSAVPNRPVIVFTGDGGLWYHLSELETAARWNLPLTIIVNNNSSLNQEINIWTDAYGGELKGRHHELWQFRSVDFSAIAREIGVEAIRVEHPGELKPAIRVAVETPAPYLIDVVTDRYALAPEAFLPQGMP